MSTPKKILAAVLVIVALGAGVGWWLGLFSSDPEEANIDDLSAAVADDAAGDDADDDAEDVADGEAALTEIDGTWSIVALDEVFAGFRIDEVLSGLDFTAVARTNDVTGTLVAAGTTINEVEVVVDVNTLATDNPSRDGQIRGTALEAETFPTATFVLTEPIELGAIPGEGETVTVDAVGDLTIHGVTQSVTIPLDASQQNGQILVAGQVDISIADFDVETPSAPMVASISDTAVLEVSLAFAR